jgi:hypothetical protein
VVWSLATALDFFSNTITLSPANAAARAQASPAKLAPTTSRSTTVFELRSPADGGAGQAAKKGGVSKREEELEANMGELTWALCTATCGAHAKVSYAMCARREACVNSKRGNFRKGPWCVCATLH